MKTTLPPCRAALSRRAMLHCLRRPIAAREPALARRPTPQPGMEQGPPLPVAAYLPWTPPGIRPPWPEDEWLRDGGDCGVPVGVSDGAAGLQMEDTVAVYDTLDGRTMVTPSNDVYIYSPRFAAVRQVVGLVLNEQRDRSSDVQLNTSLAAPTVIQKVGAAKQQVQLEDEISARPAHAFRMKQGDGALSSELGPRGFQNAFKPYENISIIRNGIYVNSESMMLARGQQAAIAWTHEQEVQIILDLKGAMAAVEDEQAGTVFTVDRAAGQSQAADRQAGIHALRPARRRSMVYPALRQRGQPNHRQRDDHRQPDHAPGIRRWQRPVQPRGEIFDPAQRRRLAGGPLRTGQAAGSGQRRRNPLLLPRAVDSEPLVPTVPVGTDSIALFSWSPCRKPSSCDNGLLLTLA